MPVPEMHAGILVTPVTGKWIFSWFDQTIPASDFLNWKETKQMKKKFSSKMPLFSKDAHSCQTGLSLGKTLSMREIKE